MDDLGTVFERLRWTVADYRTHELGSGVSRREDGAGVRFHFVRSGGVHVRGDDLSVDLRTGDFLLLPHGGPHTVTATVAGAVPAAAPGTAAGPGTVGPGTVLHTGRFAVTSPEAGAIVAAMPATVVACCIVNREPVVAALIDGMAAEAGSGRPGSGSVISQLAGAVAMAALRSWVESGCGDARLLTTPLHDSDVSRALSAIHGAPGTQWTVDSLARVALASRSAFAKRFRDAVGESPARYLARVRMEQAKHLLGERTTVAEVAVRLGYGSEAAFSRAFRRHAGVPPTRWRHTDAPAFTPSAR